MSKFKFYVVYQTTNLVNGKIYIGQHRTNLICDGYLGSSVPLLADIKKYGKTNFKRIVLALCQDEKDLNRVEGRFVTQEFVERKDTYNKIIGGINGDQVYSLVSMLGNKQRSLLLKQDLEYRKKLGDSIRQARKKSQADNPEKYREAQKKRIASLRAYNHNNPDKRGLRRCHTQAEIKNMKQSLAKIQHSQGSKNSQFGTCWIHNGTTNKKVKVTEKELHLNQGWILGRVIKLGLNNVLAS